MASITKITRRRRAIKKVKRGKKRKYEIRRNERLATKKIGKELGII